MIEGHLWRKREREWKRNKRNIKKEIVKRRKVKRRTYRERKETKSINNENIKKMEENWMVIGRKRNKRMYQNRNQERK